MTGILGKAAKAYASLAVILVSMILLFVVINGACFIYLRGPVRTLGIDTKYLPFELPKTVREEVYPGMSAAEMSEMLQESWAIAYEYAPYREFQPKATRGKYTSNHEAGFRYCKDQGPWPPVPENFNVFLFGGSTAYNVGVPQDDTIATHLQEALKEQGGKPVRVYNFGCPMFFSSPERVLFEQLLLAGHKPDVAVFLDGLNEYFHVKDEPGFSGQIGTLFENSTSVPFHLRSLADQLPVVRVLRERWFRPGANERTETEEELQRKDILESIQQRYLANIVNIEAVAAANTVKALFIWQPVPSYKYKGAHPYELAGWRGHGRSRYGYRMMADYVARNKMPSAFVWLADMQEGLPGMLYIDLVHYSGRMSKEVAVRIAAELHGRGMLD